MARIGIVVGSLRKESFNRTVANEAMVALRELGAEAVEIDYRALPILNQDIEFPVLDEVASVRKQVSDVDALWFFTPQHNDSMSAAVKNLVDWLSRRDTPEAPREEAVVFGKPVTVSGISGPAATAGARADLGRLCTFVGARVMEDNQAGLVLPVSAWTEGTYEASEEDREALRTQAKAFLEFLG